MVAVFGVAAVIAVFAVLPPFPQPQWYHRFADQRAFAGVPNFLNVASNLLFLVAGVAGLAWLPRVAAHDARERRPYAVFFGGLALVAFGSGWYHLAPGDAGLVWDRLAMVVAFSGWVAAQIGERTSVRAGVVALPVLLAVGIGSVLYWFMTEAAGRGDLRPYGIVQFYPMLLVPLLVLLFPGRYTRGRDALGTLGLYGMSLVADVLDPEIFALTGVVSGHTLKHVVAAGAGFWVLWTLRHRTATPV